MALTDHKPRGVLRLVLRMPIWLYRARLGRLMGNRLLYIAHRGRRTGARHEVVVETVRYDAAIPEVIVIAAWGGRPDWFRNLQAGPAIEVRLGGNHWPDPAHRVLDPDETRHVLLAYQRAHPRAWKHLAPMLGFPTDPDDSRWPQVAAAAHAIAFTPRPRE